MMRTWLAVLAAMGLAISSNPAIAANPLTADELKAFEWFGGLGFPDVKEAKYVRVLTGRWSQSGDEPPQNSSIVAFLLKGGDEFTVLTLSLETETFKKRPDDAPEHEQVAFELLDLKAEAADEIKALRARLDAEQSDLPRRFGERLAERAEVFVFAWGCWRHGLVSEAHDLYALAAQMPSRRGDRSRPGKAFPQAVADDIAHAQMWRLIEDFGDPQISRDQLLERFRGFIGHYPHSEHIERAKKSAELLATMVREDAEHGEKLKTAPPFEKLGLKGQIAELIFQLRDQNGHQWMQPGACDIFSDPRDGMFGEPGKGKSPASRLAAMGYDAIPQLIEALDDERFTRSVGFHRNFYFSHYVLRIGDCAEEIISRIAGRSFYQRRSTSGAMIKDGQLHDVKAEIKAWYAEFTKKGDRQTLIDATSQGDGNSPQQAERLIEKYPEVAAGAISEGMKRARGIVRVQLVELAARMKGEEPLALLLEEMRKGPTLAGRVTAAFGLRRRRRPEAIPAMIDEWRRLPPGELSEQDKDLSPFYDGDEELIAFLATSYDADAIKALSDDLQRQDVRRRLGVVSAFGEHELLTSQSGGGIIRTNSFGLSGPLLEKQRSFAEWPPAFSDAVEALLVNRLEDIEECPDLAGKWGDEKFSDPRVCDMAAFVLAQRWSDQYQFAISAKQAVRDRQRIVIANRWRKGHDVPLLPAVEQPVIMPAPDEQMKPLLAALLNAADDEAGKTAAAKIEDVGLPAIAAVRAELAKLNRDHPAGAELASVDRRLALTVRAVTLEPESAPPDAELKAQIATFKNKPIATDAVIDLILRVTQRLPSGATGIQFKASRAGDDTGVEVTIKLTKHRIHQAGSQKGWDTRCRLLSDQPAQEDAGAPVFGRSRRGGYEEARRNGGMNSHGMVSKTYGRTREGLDRLAGALDYLFEAAPNQSFKVDISVIEEN